MSYVLPWEEDEGGSLVRRLAADAARRIVEGAMAPGDLITEVGLADEAGVSRTPARQSMLQLEGWGLVRLVPKKGAVVTAETARDRRDLLSVRAMLEASAVNSLARTPATLEPLRAAIERALEQQREAVENADPLAFANADYAFHVRIIESMDNTVVAGIIDRLGPRFARMTYTAAADRPDALSRLYEEHVELARILEAGDFARYADRAREHMAMGQQA